MLKIINPESGANIKDRFTYQGKVLDLDIPVNKSVNLPEEVASYILEKYGFVQIGEDVVTEAKIDGMYYCENNCGYANKYKVAVAGHQKGCEAKVVEVKEMATKTIEEEPMVSFAPANGMDGDGVEWYGNGLEEDRSPMSKERKINTLGNFGAA